MGSVPTMAPGDDSAPPDESPGVTPPAPASPIMEGTIGELFHATPDAVIVLAEGQVLVTNPAAKALFGVDGEAVGEVVDLAALLALPTEGMTRVDLRPLAVVDVLRRDIGPMQSIILRDVTTAVRHAEGLRRIAELGRSLLGEPPTVAAVLQVLATEAKQLTGARYSAVVLLRPGSLTDISHFVYDAPRHLFPHRNPRMVGLLGVPVSSRVPARIDDIRGHPAGVGLPGVHPPIGPLLAVPVLGGSEVLGELAVANGPEDRAFDEVDEQLLVDLAAHVGAAVRWAQQAERAREEELLRQEIVDTARHDVRTPLGAGKGYAQLLTGKLDQLTPGQIRVALEGITDAFARIESFAHRLLIDERLSLAGVLPRWEVLEIGGLLEAVRRDIEAVAGRDAVEVVRENDSPQVLAGDAEMVREVLDNLVGNAVKHGPQDRPVVVSVRFEGDHVRVDVRDEGPGIPEAEQAALFERWTRTDSSRTRQVPGLGLGLSIVKRLVTAHGGTLGVSSRAGEGATFWVTFPATVPE